MGLRGWMFKPAHYHLPSSVPLRRPLRLTLLRPQPVPPPRSVPKPVPLPRVVAVVLVLVLVFYDYCLIHFPEHPGASVVNVHSDFIDFPEHPLANQVNLHSDLTMGQPG